MDYYIFQFLNILLNFRKETQQDQNDDYSKASLDI